MEIKGLDETLVWLGNIVQPVTASMSYVHWLNARNADTDQGNSYCRDCCDSAVERLNATHPEHEYFRDGGWPTDADHPENCCECGATLDCSLTTHGVEYELDHYETERLSLRGKRSDEVAYNALQILEGSYNVAPDTELAKRCRRFARRLTAAYRRRKSNGQLTA